MNSEISFWKYIESHNIEIPIIQRDYAQGREGQEYLRESLLKNIKQALDRELPDSGNILKLDFVYGALDNGVLSPLDGQQRLTTLWLLHWFVAYKAGVLRADVRDRLRRFSYATRISSTEFCESLATEELPQNSQQQLFLKQLSFETITNHVSDIEWETTILNSLKCAKTEKEFVQTKNKLRQTLLVSSVIQNQVWFHSKWKQDPTVQSMLRMLSGATNKNKDGKEIIDGMEELFESCSPEDFISYWDILTGDNCPILFYQLPMHEFRLTDDLYIKMNARGKQLTSFENFKAEIQGFIRDKGWNDLLNDIIGIGAKMDNTWTDIFWANRSSKGKIDEIYFTFLNRYFLNYKLRDIDEKSQYYEFFTQKGDDLGDNAIRFNSLDHYKWNGDIDEDLFNDLNAILDNYQLSEILPSDMCAPWDDKFRFIPEYISDNGQEVFADKEKTYLKVTSLNQVHRVVFYAVCKYFKEGATEQGKQSFNRWMRFVWNLVSVKSSDGNPTIRNVAEMKNALVIIDKFDSHHIYEGLYGHELVEKPNNIEQQFNEEILKVRQLFDPDSGLIRYDGQLRNENGFVFSHWENAIRMAEACAFFNGSIRFLFTSGNGEVKWNDFDTKYTNAKQAFEREHISTITLRNLIFRIRDWDKLTTITMDCEKKSWRNILLDNRFAMEVHLLLTEFSFNEEQLSQQPSPFVDTQKIAHEDLYQTRLTRQLRWQPFKLSNGYPYRLVPPGAWAQYKIYHIGTPRNRILAMAFEEGHVFSNHTEQRLGDSGYFWGDDINFKYKSEKHQKEYRFQWWHNRTIKKFDVYLMTREWDYTKRQNEASVPTGTDADKYFCANVPDDADIATLYSILDGIIDMYKDDKVSNVK